MKKFSPQINRILSSALLILLVATVAFFGQKLILFAQQSLQNLNNITLQKSDKDRSEVISMSSEEEPSISLGSWSINGETTIKLYKANEGSLINALVHDEENQQINPVPDVSKFNLITEIKTEVKSGYDNKNKIDLPLEPTGVWYMTLESGDVRHSAYIVRSKYGLIARESKDTLVFWGQKFSDLRKLDKGLVTLYDLEGSIKPVADGNLNSDGILELPKGNQPDIAVLRLEGDFAIAPINMQYLNADWISHRFNYEPDITHFIFTDRPIYKPGGKMHFKAVLRTDDDARYTTPNGLARVIIHRGWDKQNNIFDKYFPINSNGAVDGEFDIPESLSTGGYSIFVAHESEDIEEYGSGKSKYFEIEHFRKPEYFLEVDSPNLEIVRGDTATFEIQGQFFSGKPLTNEIVKYSVSHRNAYDSEYLRNSLKSGDKIPYYNYISGQDVKTGSEKFDDNGKAVVSIDTEIFKAIDNKLGVLSLEAEYIDESGNPVKAVQSILMYPGEFSLYRSGYSYSSMVNQEYKLDLELVSHQGKSVSNRPVIVKVERRWWEKDETRGWNKESEKLDDLNFKSDSNGKIEVKFTPTKTGSYYFTVDVEDARGNIVSREFTGWIRDDKYNYFSDYWNSGLSISADQESYQPGDTAKIFIQSDIPNRDVLLSLQRERVGRYQVVSLYNNSAEVDLEIIDEDMPNVYANVSGLNSHTVETNSQNILVPADKKKIDVTVTPDKDIYGPGQTAVVNILTQDSNGNPVPAEVALWSADKALYELADDKTGNIFNTFWKERYNSTTTAHSLEGIIILNTEQGGGCFLESTKILMEDGTTKNIQDVSVGEKVLTKKSEDSDQLVIAEVLDTHEAEVGGYMIINQTLKVTPDHLTYLNGVWQEIGNAKIGDELLDSNGSTVEINTIEWLRSKEIVYNLEIDQYNTFFANGIWVHNQKGDTRSVFKDTAYWNPSIQTDSSGRAQVNVTLPDNLTTWVFAAVASNASTQVGQTTAEVKVAKDLVVRPILPNLLRTGDVVDFSTLVHNFTNNDDVFDVSLSFEGSQVPNPVLRGIEILSNSLEELAWNITIGAEELVSKVAVKAESSSKEIDEVISQLPIVAKGFSKKTTMFGYEPMSFDIKYPDNVRLDKSNLEISLASTKAGTVPSAMSYLIDYPYGCVEQTTSRFVPVLLANENKVLFANVIKGKDLGEMIEKGFSRLTKLQNSDGGWGWWTSGGSDPFITSYVVEHLIQAQNQGYELPNGMLERVEKFLQRTQYYDIYANKTTSYTLEQEVFRIYTLSLLGSEEGDKTFDQKEIDSVSSDVLPFAVMLNSKNGVDDPNANGLNRLISLGKLQGESMYWDPKSPMRFGSIDSATAIATRAILVADPNNKDVNKAMNYLARNRKREYWSNTFSTVQVAKAMLEYSKVKQELTSNYSYSVKLDGKVVGSGIVSPGSQLVKKITIPANEVLSSGSQLVVEKQGEGQIYSTVVVNEFHTKTEEQTPDNEIKISRTYVSERGYKYGVTVGDLVTVELKVEGLDPSSPYAVIEDELPAGLIPINTNLDNQSVDYRDRQRTYGETRETTQNGIVIALHRGLDKDIVTYKARAIASGEFYAPPAKVEMVYNPELNAMSNDEVVVVTQDPKVIREGRPIERFPNPASQRGMSRIQVIILEIIAASLFVAAFFSVKYRVKIKYYLLNLIQRLRK